MRTSDRTQRNYNDRQAREYADNFDLEGFGYPVLNHRDEVWYIVDGQHRIAALRMMGWDDQQIECEVYEGLSEAEEAELFLKRNHRRAVKPFDKFKVAVSAGREAQCDINRIVLTQGLKVSKEPDDGCVQAVTALEKIYSNFGARTLARTLRITRDSYAGDREGLRGNFLLGLGLACGRYDGQLDEEEAVRVLAKVPGGALGILGKAQTQRRSTGESLPRCVAFAVVEAINAKRQVRKRLPQWWATEVDQEQGAE
jgi:hypothetical protein